MKMKDLLTIVTVALGTASLTVITFSSGTLNAGDEENKLAATIAKPKLVCHGIEMTLATPAGRTFAAGEEPTWELTAVNTTGETATASVQIAMTGSSPADMMSRVPRIPSALWQQNETIVMQPYETKAIIIPVSAKLPAKSMIGVTLREVDPAAEKAVAASPEARRVVRLGGVPQGGIVALSFSTTVPAVQTASIR